MGDFPFSGYSESLSSLFWRLFNDLAALRASLPIPCEINALFAGERVPGDAVHLPAVGALAVIFAPARFLRIAEEIRPGNPMVMTLLRTAQAGKERLRLVRAGVEGRIGQLVIDAADLKFRVQVIP